ncbi:MAG: FAD-dependent oxidoreductase [Burkholderiaceae bacterium]
MRHVIIGNGPAGVTAAETIRKHRPSDDIVLIGDEPGPPYSRMAIPYLLVGDIEQAGTHLRKSAGHFDALGIKQVAGQVKSVSASRRLVGLASGETIEFDKCLIASGSVPQSPPIPGLDSDLVQTCWTLADADRIMALAKPGARVLQMGAGFIGCIILESLVRRGVKLTVVEMGDRMVPRMMGEGAGGMIRAWCEQKGVRVLVGTRVEALEAGAPLRAKLSDGSSEDFDLVIQATGVRPSIGFLADSSIKCDRGVLVDQAQMSSAEGIYAAGDCAEAFDPATNTRVVSAIQPNAVEQARVAAMNMAGHPTSSRGVTQINVLDTLGLVSTSFGQWQGVDGGERAELSDPEGFRYLCLEFKDDVLIGANSVGMTDHVGVLRNLIEGHVRLGPWKDHLLADPTRLMEAYLACAQSQAQWQGRARGTAKA